MADKFDSRLILELSGVDSNQSITEWAEKTELVCYLSRVMKIELVIPMHLTAIYQQLGEKKGDFSLIRDSEHSMTSLTNTLYSYQVLIKSIDEMSPPRLEQAHEVYNKVNKVYVNAVYQGGVAPSSEQERSWGLWVSKQFWLTVCCAMSEMCVCCLIQKS